eukprot:CAMPEP_0176127884 /NCGR_PEP_ID=MMETSP0120_2-20121206/64603_1 /TAXON_ID=160619 /ORGANISM="Kryptoperidinium foliaceum, Strain CCMP 1326" /LENGTH=33 /DNA_ID= /DNA_START= /DNA_END= /DNA_ORIENTATION=
MPAIAPPSPPVMRATLRPCAVPGRRDASWPPRR